ncbi:MAG TPA: protease complex subunit PrcB family protein [Pyrinomonadaceae bacterium]|jgi:hypothetical protein
MTKYKALLIFGLFTVFIFGTAAQSDCDSKKNKNAPVNTNSNGDAMSDNKKPAKTPRNGSAEVKTLAEGSFGKIEQPFLFVVRSAETYRQLQNVFAELPPDPGINFDEQAVIAAFAGTKSTGGYSVEIKKSGEKVSVSVVNPPKDAMLTQALTMPYQVAIVPVEAEKGLKLEVSTDWKNAAQTFKLSSGEFESSGGFAGRLKKFTAQGTINVWRFEDLVTFDFNLSGADKNMQLTEMASGVAKNGKIDLVRLDAGSFSEGPKPPVKATGTIADDKLTLTLEPLPTNIRDGFQVSGKLEAVKSK